MSNQLARWLAGPAVGPIFTCKQSLPCTMQHLCPQGRRPLPYSRRALVLLPLCGCIVLDFCYDFGSFDWLPRCPFILEWLPHPGCCSAIADQIIVTCDINWPGMQASQNTRTGGPLQPADLFEANNKGWQLLLDRRLPCKYAVCDWTRDCTNLPSNQYCPDILLAILDMFGAQMWSLSCCHSYCGRLNREGFFSAHFIFW